MNLLDAIDGYLDSIKMSRGLSEKTIKLYRIDLKRFLLWAGNLNVEAIGVEMVSRFRLYLVEEYKNKSSHNYGEAMHKSSIEACIMHIRDFLRYVKAKGWTTINPEEIKILKYTHKPRYALNCEELEKILDHPRTETPLGLRNKAILELFVSTGLRRFELAKLNRQDIDIEKGHFTIIGKGDKAGTVYLNDRAKYWLRKYLEIRSDNCEALFINHLTLKRLTTAQIQRMIYDNAKEAGVTRPVSSHILRHTYATLLIRNNVNIVDVKTLMRHSDIRTTMVYLQTENPDIKKVHDRALKF